MPEWLPVYTLADLESLNDEEILEGYWDGRENEPEPGNNRSRSYWHGWRNGRLDGGFAQSDAAQMGLAKEFLENERKKHA